MINKIYDETTSTGFIFVSDIHISPYNYERLYKEFFEENGFFDKCKTIIKDLEDNNFLFGGFLVLGDLFDTKMSLHSKAIDLAQDVVQRMVDLSINHNDTSIVLMLRGTYSHDYSQLKLFNPYTKFYKDRFIIVNHPMEFNYNGLNILAIPEEYTKNHDDLGYDKFFNKKYDLFLTHTFFKYNCFNKNESEKSLPEMYIFDHEKVMKMARITLCGHDHHRHTHENKIFYNGSFSRNNFGEEGEKGFHLLLLDKGTQDVIFVENELAPIYSTINSKFIINHYPNIANDEDKIKALADAIIDYKAKNNIKYLKVFFNDNSFINYDSVQLIKNFFKHSIFNKEITIAFNFFKNSSGKLQLQVEDSEEDLQVKDTRFDFLFDNKLTTNGKIAKFISIQNPLSSLTNEDNINNLLNTLED